ncbi:MAG: tRNA (adenosine(37)-N6)-dimethylallyltransferase MiaA [Oscillospiraceae bacterium]|nr:tRNA (adenosine(37)-N6)-dimethylallyltransferase MiaA [Oscillospiraceae bacterium]MBR0211718.1 tRNA (adenosine(37)-N6)-dimethylallyltransferase MiaA [Oscillospiraceae bacterium]
MAKLLCVVGPTASGKTKMGVALARRFGGEVVSADSMQIYRGMTVGTAAPTAEEMEGVPHHMIAVAGPSESWSVARYVAMADGCVQDILSRGKLPVLVGGTGLWLDALVQGMDFAPGAQGEPVRRALQQRLQAEGAEALLAELRQIDPPAAAKMHPKDVKRILRALEVYQTTGRTFTEQCAAQAARPPRYEAAYVGLDYENRDDLRRRIDARVDDMVAHGLLQEVEALLSSGLSPDATALQAIGYKQFLAVEQGLASVDEAVAEVKLRSRQYAKRQLTWLRRNKAIHWIFWGREPNFPAALQDATEYLTACGLG